MTDKPELLPCPFCGGEPKEYDQIGYSSVKCDNCKFSIKRKAEDGAPYAVELWNRRAGQAAKSVPEWQPIETAPKDGTFILLFTAEGMIEGYWGFGGWDQCVCSAIYSESGVLIDCKPTHWMPPLPPPAKKDSRHD